MLFNTSSMCLIQVFLAALLPPLKTDFLISHGCNISIQKISLLVPGFTSAVFNLDLLLLTEAPCDQIATALIITPPLSASAL